MTTQRDSKGQFQLNKSKTVFEHALLLMAAKQAEEQITLLVQQILE